MTRYSRSLALFAIIAAVLLPAAGARAQYYGAAPPPPLYPYAVPQSQPYAIQVAPNTYVIHRPARPRADASVRCVNCGRHRVIAVHRARRLDHKHKPVDRALVAELRKRSEGKDADAELKKKDAAESKQKDNVGDAVTKRTVFRTKRIVRDRPVVIVHKRYVDDPPRVIDRRIVVDDAARANCNRGLMTRCDTVPEPVVTAPAPDVRVDHYAGKRRVINAEAEITIMGPDRMNIRLFRKGHAPSDRGMTDE